MPLPANTNNNKESFRLLDLSTDMDSDDLHLEIAPSKKKKVQRKGRSRVVARGAGGEPGGAGAAGGNGGSGARVGRTVRYAGYAAALVWLVVLTYAAAALHERLSTLDVRLQTVSTSSDGVSEALQRCHSAAKELRANTSSLDARLATLSAAHDALADNFTRTAAELRALQEKLAAAPQLADTPRRLDGLSQTVADFGSRLGGFDESIKSAHETAQAAVRGLQELRLALNASAVAANASAAERAVTLESLRALNAGIDALNVTIATRLSAAERRLDDYAAQLAADAAAVAELRARTAPPVATTGAPAPALTATPAPAVAQKPAPESTAAAPAAPAAPTAAPAASAAPTAAPAAPTKPGILESPA